MGRHSTGRMSEPRITRRQMLAAAGVLTILPGALVIWFVRHHLARGLAMGRV